MQSLQYSKMLRCIILSVLIAGGFEGAMSADRPPMPGPFIVGGTRTDIRDHPYQLSLQTTGHICGASIIDKKWAVTAAHCVGLPANRYGVRAGNSDTDLGTYYPIKNVISHPNYNETTMDYDVALLEINGTITFNDNVKAVKLAKKELPVGAMVNVTGWGATMGGGPSTQYLMRVSVPIVNKESCQSSYNDFNLTITDRMVCAGYQDGGKDSCHGDSGGPLSTKGILYGIVSWGYGCAQPNYPGVYGNVPNLRHWIKQTSGI